VTVHCDLVIAVIFPLFRPAHRRTTDVRTVEPTRPVPFTATTAALGAVGALTPIELPDVTVKV
jgi:hypothetical protein